MTQTARKFPLVVKTLLGASLLGLAGLGLAGCEKLGLNSQPKLDTDQKKYSFALGQIIGNDMRSKGVVLDLNAFNASFKAALDGKPNTMSEEDMQKAMMALREASTKKMREALPEGERKQQEEAEKQKAEAAAKNLAESKAFLEQNKSKPDVKVTASGLQYIIQKPGAGKSPEATSTVSVTYKGTLTSGEQFDASLDKPVEFQLNRVIPGWTEGLQLLKPGGKMTLFVPPELGYGERDIPGIRANSALIFEIELKSVKK